MFARKGKELLKEVARCEPGHLPPYNDDLVRQVFEEVDEHHGSMSRILREVRENVNADWDAAPEGASSVIIHHESLLRNKRLLLAYTNARLQKVKDVRWRLGAQLPEELKKNTSRAEQEDKEPPQDPLILVKVLEEQGDIMVNGKQMCLQAGSVHRMERDLAEPLIAQGHLLHIDAIM